MNLRRVDAIWRLGAEPLSQVDGVMQFSDSRARESNDPIPLGAVFGAWEAIFARALPARGGRRKLGSGDGGRGLR